MDRDGDRRRDIPPEDQYGTGRGQSYRPGNVRERSPPRMDSYRARSPPRRPDYMQSDSYRAPRPRSRSPPRRDDFRRRSPSPRFRDREVRGGDSYRGRPRSPPPPRREHLPRDDLFRRDPVHEERDYRDNRDFRDDRDRAYPGAAARSPLPRFRDRSAVPLKRTREPSPVSSRGRRTPPPAKRERLASPPRGGRFEEYPQSRGASPPRRRFSPDPRERRPSPPRGVTRDYRLRSRSPLARNDRVDPRSVDDWRRPRSPARDARQGYTNRDESAINSNATSRRSSPPVHPSRAAMYPAADERPRSSKVSPRDAYGDDREPYRASDVDSRPLAIRESGYEDDRKFTNDREPVPPPRETRREDDIASTPRAPPTGPSSQRAAGMSMTPPTGPAAVTPSGPRAAGAPPVGPRGAPTPRGDFSTRGRGGFGGEFGGRGRGFGGPFRGSTRGGAPGPGLGRGDGGFGRGETSFSQPDATFGSRPPPSGPRGSSSQAPGAPFRQNSTSSATTYPRSQRFGNGDAVPDVPTGPKAARRPTEPALPAIPTNRPHPALADLPKVVEGGIKAEPLIDRSKLYKLEDEAEKLRRQIDEKETRKRKALREWDRMRSETEAAALRSELAEQALKQLNGEAESQAAF